MSLYGCVPDKDCFVAALCAKLAMVYARERVSGARGVA